jgi:membrane protein DedA with SNARE-associated domain
MSDASETLAALGGPSSLLVVMGIVLAETGLLAGLSLPGDSLPFSAGVLLAGGVIHLAFAVLAIGAVVSGVGMLSAGHLLGGMPFIRSTAELHAVVRAGPPPSTGTKETTPGASSTRSRTRTRCR